jgi:hypothetical protein
MASFLLLLFLAAPAGDVYFEQLTVTRVDGQEAGPGVLSRVWFGSRKIRLEAGDAPGGPALILRLDQGRAFRLDPAQRTALELDVDRLRAQSMMDLSVAGSLMGGVEEARTRPLPRPKTVAGYPCHGFRISMGSTILDVYVADDVPVGVDAFAEFLEWTGASQAMAGLMAEIRRLPGFPLETRSRVTVLGRVQETLSTVTKVKVGPHPASLFEPPEGFRRVKEEPEPER